MKNCNRPMLILTLLMLVLTVGAARAAAGHVIYLPLVSADATRTPTPTIVPTPTPTFLPHTVIEVVQVVNSATEDPLDEYVEIRNRASNPYNLTGWFIRTENSYRYDFPNGFQIYGYRTIRVWSGAGTDTSYNLYWNSDVEIWNNFGDCAYLRNDSNGENDLISVYCYDLPLWMRLFR